MNPHLEKMEEQGRRRNSKLFLLCTSILLVLLLSFPWMFGVSCLFFIAGHYLLERILEKVEVHVLKSDRRESPAVETYQLDPLLHPTPYSSESTEEGSEKNLRKGSDPVTCTVCDTENCPRGADPGSPDCLRTNGNQSHDLRVDPRLDKALARFCTTVFDFYVSSHWAPYETRKQLRLAFKRLLSNFGEKLETTLAKDEQAVTFTQEKIIPLCIHYVEKLKNKRKVKLTEQVRQNQRKELERTANLKTRRLCLQLFRDNLPPEDQKCGLWMELCVAVLADGVLWNLFLLGRNRLPGVFLNLAEHCKRTIDNASWPPRNEFLAFMKCKLISFGSFARKFVNSKLNSSQNVVDEMTNENQNSLQVHSSVTGGNELLQVPLLLDSFVDPSNDLYQPDLIRSRWRPRLEEVLHERELLYCFIQYLKGNRALEYLQAVLDDSPDGNEYCKKVLQLEHLPSFCRSKFFMESLGVSQVDCALEAGNDSPGSRRKGHSRSSSAGGGGNSGIQIWKIGDPKAVDGLPLHSNQSGASVAQYPESEASIRKRQYSIDMVITKFVQSTFQAPRVPSSEGKDPPLTRRVGIDAKRYSEDDRNEIMSKVVVGTCDIYDSFTETCVSLVNNHNWIRPVLTGWFQHLRPFMKPMFDRTLENQLRQHMCIETCVYLIDLVTDAFHKGIVLASEGSSEPETGDRNRNLQIRDSDHLGSLENSEEEKIAQVQQSLITLSYRLLSDFIDPVALALMFQGNEDEIILFFVDLLDLLVNQVCGTQV